MKKSFDRGARVESLKAQFPKRDYDLTESQYLLLAGIACSDGCDLTEAEMLKAGLTPNAEQRKEDLAVLKQRSFITYNYSWESRGYCVPSLMFLKVTLNALLYWPEAVEKVEKIRRTGKSERFRMVSSLVESDEVYVPQRFTWTVYDDDNADMLQMVVIEPAFYALFPKLNASLVHTTVMRALDSYLEMNFVAPGILDAFAGFVRRLMTGAYRTSAMAKVEGIRFLCTGKCRWEDVAAAGSSVWPAAVAGISDLYAGKYEEAAVWLENALKIRNKGAKVKNVFQNAVLTYFLILSYLLNDTDKNRRKLAQYLKKDCQNQRMVDLQAPGLVLAKMYSGMPDEQLHHTMQAYIRNNSDYNSYMLILGMAKSRGFGVEFPEIRPDLAIVRHELGMGDKDENLEALFGGTPLISRLKVKKPWEIALENLSDMISGSKGDAEAEKAGDRRIMYILRNSRNVEIREQTRLKSGRWGQGKVVSTNTFRSGGYDDICDGYDRKVQPRLESYSYHYTEEVLPVLVGCDRIFLESYDPANRVEVAEELPYVDVSLKRNEYVFTNNVPKEKYDREYKLENVICRDKLHYSVIRLNRIQAQVLQRLSETGVKFPKEATEALKTFIGKLSTVIEVHSPLLESGSSLELRQGSAMLYFRIIPRSGRFDALLYVRPLENGKLSFYPGEGDASFYDSDDSARYQVKRNLKAERTSLASFLTKTGLDDFDAEDGTYALEAEDMLPVLDACRDLGDIVTLEWPEGRSLRILGALTPQKISINVRSKEQWFELEGSAQLPDGQSLDIEQILAAIAAGGYGGGYLKLGESDYVSLSESLAKYLKRLESVTQSGRGGERVSLFQTGALADIVHKSHLDIHADKSYREKLARVEEAASLNPAVPSGLKAELRDYQEEGYKWMVRLDHWGAGACLADDMGLGKTVQTIAFLLYKAASGASLVVAPASVMMNWSRELARFSPSLKVTVLNEQDDRTDALAALGEYDVVLTTYGLLVREKEALTGVEWNVVCLDEAHTIKNRGTKMSEAAMSLKAASRVILTGTPVQNYLGELWNLFQFLNPGLLGSYEAFSRKFISPIEASEDKERQAQLKRILQPFMLRRTKSEVVEELPEKTEIFRTVPLSAAETVAYETMRLEAKNELDQDTRVNMNALAAITRLREAACAMPLVKTGWEGEPTKLGALRELIADILSGGNSVLVFSQFTGFLDIVSRMLAKEGTEHFYLQGSTPLKKRQEMVSGFQRGEKPVFLISLKAGGLGLNLTGANYVIHLDPWWNPAVEQQATDRAYRIGQQQNVTVYHLIAEGTIEEKILRLHKTKQNLADAILEGASVSHAITLDELRELIR